MHFTNDPRKRKNLMMFSAMWVAGALLFFAQHWVEGEEIAARLRELTDSRHQGRSYNADEIKTNVSHYDLSADDAKLLDRFLQDSRLTKAGANSAAETQRIASIVRPAVERTYPVHRNIHQVYAWCVWALAYMLFVFALYSRSPLPARQTEAPLNVIDVGFISTALQISGGFDNHAYLAWFGFYAFQAYIVAIDLRSTTSHRLAKYMPYYFAFVFTLFFATYGASVDSSYFVKAGSFVLLVTLVLVIVAIAEDRDTVSKASATPGVLRSAGDIEGHPG